MRVRDSLSLIVMLIAAAVAGAAEPPAPKAVGAPVVPPREGKRETINLFNGKDLTGWTGHVDKYWSVRDGMIVGKNTDEIKVSTYLLTERKFSDFRLTFDFKLAAAEMHSGLAMWGRLAPEQGDPYTYAGHLVMFPSNYGFFDLYGRRGIHANAAIAKPAGKQHDWNHIEILAQGNRIRFVLNGKLISDWREPEPDRIKEAPIGLQLHSNKVPQEVQWKNLVIETFPEDVLKTAVILKSGGSFTGATTIFAGTLTLNTDNDDGKAEPLNITPPCCVGLGNVKKFRVYFGTYTKPGKSQGIYRAELDLATGKLSEPVLAVETKSPSFLVVHPSRKFLYAVGESGGTAGGKAAGGAVSAFAVDEKTGDLKFLNEQSSNGGAPCHITIDAAGKNVLIANYTGTETGGNCGVLPINADGTLAEMSSMMQHSGPVFDPKRQKLPHAHSINLDAAGKFAFCADLGLDKVLIYKFDSATGKLTPNDPPAGETAKRAGPRHFAFHPSGKFAYVINEINCTVTAFAYDADKGSLKEIQTISTLPPGVEVIPQYSTAEVQVHPSGKFVYGSNRMHNTIVAYQCDPATGKLTLVGHQGEGVKVPRNFGIDPTGKYALVCNQDGDSVIVFAINQETGALEKQLSTISVFSPVCVKFVPIAE